MALSNPNSYDEEINHVVVAPEFVDKKMKMKMKMKVGSSSSTVTGPLGKSRVSLTLDKAIEHELEHGKKLDPNMDRRKLRRTISNRLSAQRSRIKKAQHVDSMEKLATDLQEFISILGPQVESCKQSVNFLMLENDALKQNVEIRTNESRISEIEIEEKRVEIRRLREVEKAMETNGQNSGLRLKHITAQSYESLIGFYENDLQQFAPNFDVEQTITLDVEATTSSENYSQEEAETDQYLNFEAAEENVDPTSYY